VIRCSIRLLAAVGQQFQDGPGIVWFHDLQVAAAEASNGHRVGVGVVGLAAAAAAQRPHPGGESGGYVEHPLAVGGDPLRQAEPDPAGALDRPGAVPPRLDEPFELLVAVAVVREPLLG
jgi:hypothetical protein